MKHKLLKKTGLYLSIVVLLPCIAHATVVGTVQITGDGYYAHDSIDVWGGYFGGMPVNAGVAKFYKSSGTGEGNNWADGPIGAFCVELAEPRSISTITYDVIMPADGPRPTTFLGDTMGSGKAKYLQELWGRYYSPSWVTSGTFTSTQNSQAAAFAAAIWEIVHENFTGNPLDWDVTVDGTPGTGGFAAVGVDSVTANKWLHSLDGTGPMADLRVFSYDGFQDFLVAVPEPATMALLGFGSLLMMRRKRKA